MISAYLTRLRAVCRALRGRITVASLAADVAAIQHDHVTRLARCRATVADMHAWINADPDRSRAWHEWRARHPVRVTPRRPR